MFAIAVVESETQELFTICQHNTASPKENELDETETKSKDALGWSLNYSASTVASEGARGVTLGGLM